MYWTARTMYDMERGCGCNECVVTSVYDRYSNNQAEFSSAEEATNAAREACTIRGDDRWGITGPLG